MGLALDFLNFVYFLDRLVCSVMTYEYIRHTNMLSVYAVCAPYHSHFQTLNCCPCPKKVFSFSRLMFISWSTENSLATYVMSRDFRARGGLHVKLLFKDDTMDAPAIRCVAKKVGRICLSLLYYKIIFGSKNYCNTVQLSKIL